MWPPTGDNECPWTVAGPVLPTGPWLMVHTDRLIILSGRVRCTRCPSITTLSCQAMEMFGGKSVWNSAEQVGVGGGGGGVRELGGKGVGGGVGGILQTKN